MGREMRNARLPLFAIALFALTGVAFASSTHFEIAPTVPLSIHALSLEANRDVEPTFETYRPTVPLIERDTAATAERIGFYPYWVTVPPAQLPYAFLSTIAFFSIEINQSGAVTNVHGWPDGDLVDTAHAHGTKVIVTITNFSASQQQTLLASSAYRATAISNIVHQVDVGGADGVNIDFENLPVSAKANFVTFIGEMDAALHQLLDNPHLSVCTPAIDWAGSYDYDKLAAHADYLFIMAYDYHYSGGDPGPVAPLYAGGIWPSWCGIDYTLDDYETYLSPYTLAKVVLGLPLYGYDWPTTSAAVPGVATGSGSAVLQHDAIAMAHDGQHGARQWDADSQTPYLVYDDGGWRQLWYTDYFGLAQRIKFGKLRGVGGWGYWALGYNRADSIYVTTIGREAGDDGP
jgi:spore germination protein YaaH